MSINISNPEWYNDLRRSDVVYGTQDGYNKVPLMYRCLRLRCNSLVNIPHYILDENGEKTDWPFRYNLDQLLWETEASSLLKGAAYWLKLRATSITGDVMDVLWLNPYYVSISTVSDTETTRLTPRGIGNTITYISDVIFHYASSQLSGSWTKDDIVYFRDFSTGQEVWPGKGAAEVSLQDSRLQFYIDRFGSHFFQGGAMPITVLSIQGNPPPEEVQRVETFFQRVASGVKNAFRAIGLSAQITPSVLTPALSELALPELKASTTEDIADSFGVPLGMIRDPNNRATAEVHRKSFYTETVIPSAKMLAKTVNLQLLEEEGLELVFAPEEMSMFQVEEAERTSSLKDLVEVGVPLETAMVILGYDLTEEQIDSINSVPTA